MGPILAYLETEPAEWVRGVLLHKGMSAPELHRRCGLPPSTCRSFLNGNRRNPTVGQFRLLLSVALDELGVKRP